MLFALLILGGRGEDAVLHPHPSGHLAVSEDVLDHNNLGQEMGTSGVE